MKDVLLLSGSIPALAAALDLAAVGVRVSIAEGVRPEMPAQAVRDAEGSLAEFLNELAAPVAEGGSETPGARPTLSPPTPIALRSRDGAWKPQPVPSVWGIPAVPLASDCINLLGIGTAARAYLDRVKPVLTIGKQENFAKLVDSRLGAKTRELLIEPVVYERFGVATDRVDVGVAAPGLNEALTRAGSLSGAALDYAERHVARETLLQPAGGWTAFGELLFERLELFGAHQMTSPLTDLVAADDGASWTAHDEAGNSFDFAALVLAEGSEFPSGELPGDGLPQLQYARTRVYAEIGIEAPDLAILHDREREMLELCEDSQGAVWSARLRHSDLAGWEIVLQSGASDGTQQEPNSVELEDIVRRLGCKPTNGDAHVALSPAPYALHSEAEADGVVFDAWHEEHPSVLLTGIAFSGGDLSLALAGARQRAIGLRRRLTGIA